MRKNRNEYSVYYNSRHYRSICISAVLDVLEKLGTSKSLAIAICIRAESIDSSLFDICPSNYFDAYAYYCDAQAIALIKKSVWFLETDNERLEQDAISKWFTTERDLFTVNNQIRGRKNFRLNSVLDYAAKLIHGILPECPDELVDDLFLPEGATAFLKGLNVNVANKLEVLDITTSALPYFQRKYRSTAFSASVVNVMTSLGSVFSTVPKDYTKVRTIAKEPMGNMCLQLEAAKHIRVALRRVGIDLKTQQDFHKFLTKEFWDSTATIDLSDASDRISIELVRALLPPDWFTYLNNIRTRFIFIDDQRVLQEKFTPQGNGFTFELETLLFWAICEATLRLNGGKGLISVYGDDMIVPIGSAECIHESLQMCGFLVNTKKSYHTGFFRESCGSDTFKGIDVRPVYLKKFRKGLYGYYELYNQIVAIEEKMFPNALIRARKRILSNIAPEHKAFGPRDLGNTVLHTEAYKVLCIDQIRYVRTLQHRIIKLTDALPLRRYLSIPTSGRSEHELAYALLGFSSDGTLLRGSPQRESFRRVAV